MSNRKIPLIAVVGPTASGKTGLAIRLAQRYHGEIVSADSMQIYEGMPIATAAPTQEEQQAVRHHLVAFLPPDVSFSVADYVKMADACIRELDAKGICPVLVGGTGLYIDSLLNYPDFVSDRSNEAVRQGIEERFDRLGGAEMLCQLALFDPDTAVRLHENDRRRIVRAFEVYQTTGLTLTQQNQLSRAKESPYKPIMIGLTYGDRSRLYERINHRVDAMVAEGLLEEAHRCLNTGATAAQAIGHKELRPYFEGHCSLNEATDRLKQQTRRYAKRQLTWFKRNERIHWIACDREDAFTRACEIIDKEMTEFVQK